MKNLRTIITSDENHEKVFIEIYSGDKFVAALTQGDDAEDFYLELPGPNCDPNMICKKVSLTNFLEAINVAKTDLTGKIYE